MPRKTTMIDGVEIEVSDQAAKIITTLRQRLADAETSHQKAIAVRDAELDTLKAALLDEAEIERRAEARADLIGLAKAIAGNVQTSGLSDAAIRKAVVIAKAGEGAVQGRSDAYIDARFDMLAEGLRKRPDLFADAIKHGINPTQPSASPAFAAYAAMVRDLESAHLAANPS